jgi:hypothetical protein
MEMMTQNATNQALSKTPLKKALSTRDKRSQLLKKKTNKEFSGNVLQDLRDKYSATDVSFLLQGANEIEASSNTPLASSVSNFSETKVYIYCKFSSIHI